MQIGTLWVDAWGSAFSTSWEGAEFSSSATIASNCVVVSLVRSGTAFLTRLSISSEVIAGGSVVVLLAAVSLSSSGGVAFFTSLVTSSPGTAFSRNISILGDFCL
jgi:hypothetical protein